MSHVMNVLVLSISFTAILLQGCGECHGIDDDELVEECKLCIEGQEENWEAQSKNNKKIDDDDAEDMLKFSKEKCEEFYKKYDEKLSNMKIGQETLSTTPEEKT